jgi:plasmid stabilization system protein ParE
MASETQFSNDYLRELEAAVDNLLLVSRRAAERFAEEHDRRVAELMDMPRMGTREAEGRYSAPIGKSGYRMVYQVAGDVVRLIGLTNARRAGSG